MMHNSYLIIVIDATVITDFNTLPLRKDMNWIGVGCTKKKKNSFRLRYFGIIIIIFL